MSVIGVVDSGAGGISTLSAVLPLLPFEEFIYVADKSHSPYGEKSDAFILRRIRSICAVLEGLGADAVLLGCNTATNVCIDSLRRDFARPVIVGVEPAVKPAVEELEFGKALVLLTPAAAKEPKFLSLLKQFDESKIIISPQPALAPLIESNIGDLKKIQGRLNDILSPLKSPQIESVVLGCTHYCLIKEEIAEVFGAKIYDGNIGAAIRLYTLLKQKKLICRDGKRRGIRLVTL